MDNLRMHHSQSVKAWVGERVDKIELFYLPSYNPELNPEERLNADLKQAMSKRVPVRTKANCAMRPTTTWLCWSTHSSVYAAIFRTSE